MICTDLSILAILLPVMAILTLVFALMLRQAYKLGEACGRLQASRAHVELLYEQATEEVACP